MQRKWEKEKLKKHRKKDQEKCYKVKGNIRKWIKQNIEEFQRKAMSESQASK